MPPQEARMERWDKIHFLTRAKKLRIAQLQEMSILTKRRVEIPLKVFEEFVIVIENTH